MFVLGILVGRDTAPIRFDIDKLQKELAELRKKTLKEELERFQIDKKTLEEKPVGFYEELKSARETIEEIVLPARPIRENKTPPSPAKKPDPGPAATEASVHASREDPIPPAPDGSSETQLAVQVASVKGMKEADGLVSRLKGKGYPAYRTIGTVPGKGIWFRVRVGPYAGRSEADRVLDRLKKENFSGFLVNYE